jgi:hypothetical protein
MKFMLSIIMICLISFSLSCEKEVSNAPFETPTNNHIPTKMNENILPQEKIKPGNESSEIEALALQKLIYKLDVPANSLTISSIEFITWPDAAIGCPKTGYTYAQVMTPGYKILISYQGEQYPVHTNASGSQIVICKNDESNDFYHGAPMTDDLIKIINYTQYPTVDIKEWISLSESKMKSRESRILTFIYPLGKIKKPEKEMRSDYADRAFKQHDVLLTSQQIEQILSDIEGWLEEDSCLDSGDIKRTLKDYRAWLEQGGDASTMQGVCERTRVVAIGVTENMRTHESIKQFQHVLIHEFYHALQQDLEMEGECRRNQAKDEHNSNSRWMTEGGAHYFTIALLSEIHGTANYHSKILETAYKLNKDGDDIDGQSDIWGAVALMLMMNQGIITEESILNGSFFHKCARELAFKRSDPIFKHIKNSWHMIEKQNEIYTFKEEATNK